jgi:hypothetical protein
MSRRVGYLCPTRQIFATGLKKFRAVVLPRFDFSLASAASMGALYQQRGADTTFEQRRPNQSKAFGI